jgi:hypothetical protein
LTRLGPNKGNRGNSIFVRALAADERGNVYLGGEAACCLERRKDTMSIAGRRLPEYGGDFYVLVASSRFTSRRTWVAFGGTGEVNAVAAGRGSAAVAGAAYSSGAVLHRAVHGRPAGNVSDSAPDGFLSVWANGVGAPTAVAPGPPKPTKRPTAGARTPAPATTARSGGGAAKLRGDRAARAGKDKGWLPLGATSRGAAGVAGATAVALLGAGALVLYGVRTRPAGARARPRSRASGGRRRR